ncbi:MAG: hypothetical protein AAF666_01315 [Pseudomonadota bacterium]
MAVFVDPATRFSQLTATSDADTFIFPIDGNTDAVIGFEAGSDRIDLSLVVGLAFDALSVRQGTGGKINIENPTGQTDADGNAVIERIVLRDSANDLRAAEMTANDFVFASATQPTVPLTNVITDRPSAFNQLIGTEAGDVFTFTVDGRNDGLRGFDDGVDVIDLSAVQGLTFDALSITNAVNGAVYIDYANGQTDAEGNPVTERIWMRDNEPGFSAASLTAEDFLFDPFSPPPAPNIVIDPTTRFSQLQGTENADVFVFGLDGHSDAIVGFQNGTDQIDLSAIKGLTFADLGIRDGNNGRVVISYDTGFDDGNGGSVTERVVLRNNHEGFFSGRLDEGDFIFG